MNTIEIKVQGDEMRVLSAHRGKTVEAVVDGGKLYLCPYVRDYVRRVLPGISAGGMEDGTYIVGKGSLLRNVTFLTVCNGALCVKRKSGDSYEVPLRRLGDDFSFGLASDKSFPLFKDDLRIIRQLALCASDDENRYALRGVVIDESDPDAFWLYATDVKRMAWTPSMERMLPYGTDKFLVHREVLPLLGDAALVGIGQKRTLYIAEDRRWYLLPEQPELTLNWKRVIPGSFAHEKKDTECRWAMFAKYDRKKGQTDRVQMYGTGTWAEYSESAERLGDKPDWLPAGMTLAMNFRCLADVPKVLGGRDRITVSLQDDHHKPVQFERDGMKYLVMPMLVAW